MSGNEHVSQAPPVELPEEFAFATMSFVTLLHAAWPSAEAEQAVAAAYAAYASAAQESGQSPEAAQRASDCYAEYTKSVREAFADYESRQCVLDAYQGYVEELKRAWARVRPAELAPEQLAAIAQSASWVAGVAATVIRACAGLTEKEQPGDAT
jgi:hypothetical protein